MIPKIIKNDLDYQTALDRIEVLMDRERKTDELELLSMLVEMYEEERFLVDLPDPVEAIRFRMEQAGLRQADLVPYFGSRSRVSEVLSGKRRLSLNMIRRLHKGLGIPAGVLIQ